MKILLVNSTAYPHIGGVENSLRFISRELTRAGHEVKVFCFQHSSDEALRMSHEGVEIIRYPINPDRWPHKQLLNRVSVAKQAIPSILKEFKPDAIWSRSAPVGLGVRRAGYKGPLLQIFPTNAKMHCRGTFLQTHGLPLRRRLMLLGLWPIAYFVSAHLERDLLRHAEAVVFSENMRDQLLAAYPANTYQCHVIPPGVDQSFFSPQHGAQQFDKIELQFGLRRDEPIVLYVGRLSSAKNIPLLMDAVNLLEHRAKLVLVGSGPEHARLAGYAQRIGLTERLVFAGSHNELLPGFYAISKVCVLPTTTESFGQVYIESLASGTPAVGFAGDGCRVITATEEILQDGKTGAIARKVSALELSEKIESIISLNEEEYFDMSYRAVEDMRKRFTWSRFVKDALTVTSKLMEG